MGKNEYLLDTNVLIEFLHGNHIVINNMLNAGLEHCHASVISYYELYFGAYNAGEEIDIQREVARVDKLRTKLDVLPLPERADNYGKIKVALRKLGRPVDEFDMIIGSQALTEGMVVVTDNIRHFKDMKGVEVVNWVK